MTEGTSPVLISQVIQFSVAPVFLLVGIAGFINAFVVRLARIVDRKRDLADRLRAPEPVRFELHRREMDIQDERVGLINLGIKLSIATAMLVCLTILTVFIDFLLSMEHPRLIGTMFVFAMASLIASLGMFVRDLQLASAAMALNDEDVPRTRNTAPDTQEH
ncbi:hypothetical protein CKO35_15475 [Ectothiorhodospira shaposhnikovii]|uniref:DUF2721 domain-containing protein n=1 Tax=Ectothiorhodospira shaposhnikovii TaxID=1054 RepID=UPI0019070A31|nr:DUF2721 domain-containing protein [Ectothiorhodospira shaposhnikovii]MBK1674664.1 hypothetical protein [Ectothiorhodospira shaposhnikovii]